MKHLLLKSVALATILSLPLSGSAQTEPTFDQTTASISDLSAAQTADTDAFTCLSGDYTIEMQGTADSQILLPITKYTSLQYTPTATGLVRIICKDGTFYAYEYDESLGFEYKGEVTTTTSVAYPTQNSSTVDDTGVNLLTNGGFPNAGNLVGSYTDRWKLPAPWVISDESLYGSFRVSYNKYAYFNTYAFVWRTDGSYQGKYFYQPMEDSKLQANAKYQVLLKLAQNTNGPGIYSIRLGSTAGGNEYASASMTVKNGTNANYRVELETPDEVAETTYFSVYNEAACNVSNTNKACTQIDYFILSEAIKAVGITNATDVVYVVGAYGPELTEAQKRTVALDGLNTAITEAGSVVTAYKLFEGDEAFHISDSAIGDLEDAIIDASQTAEDDDATATEIETATTTLQAAVSTLQNTEYNQPGDDDRFNIVMNDNPTSNSSIAGHPVSVNTDESRFIFTFEKDANYIQAFRFIPVDTLLHGYILSFLTPDGTTTYIGTASGNEYLLRFTTTQENAVVFQLNMTGTEGLYNLLSVKVNSKAGASTDKGFWIPTSDTKNIDLKITAATKATAGMTISDAHYATFIAPFITTLPDGVEAYMVSGVESDETTLVLTPVVNTIPANTPVVLYSATTIDQTASGWGQGQATSSALITSYTTDLLTGVYAQTAAPNGSYVLHNQTEGVGFYLVDTSVAAPNVPANRAYLTLPEGNGTIKALHFSHEDDGTANAIRTTLSSGNGITVIYNASGMPLHRLEHGLNIVRLSDGTTHKVYVK